MSFIGIRVLRRLESCMMENNAQFSRKIKGKLEILILSVRKNFSILQ